LTEKEASTALGVPVDAGKPPFAGAMKTCQWQQPGKAGAELFKLNVEIIDLNTFNLGKSLAAGGRGVFATPVSGVGDDAYYVGVMGEAPEPRKARRRRRRFASSEGMCFSPSACGAAPNRSMITKQGT
jgi:hypothetical protein